MKNHGLRLLSAFILVVIALSTATTALAVPPGNVAFWHTSGNVHFFLPGDSQNKVGKGDANLTRKVSIIQAANNEIGTFPKVTINGIFQKNKDDYDTDNAIRYFQARYRIKVDGHAGNNTWTKLDEELGYNANGPALPYI